MSFTNEQKAALSAPLDKANVKSREQGGARLSYIEAWKAIDEANRIFGFDGWNRETVDLRQLGEPRDVNGKMRVGYSARVRITVWAGERIIVREGCGFGQGIDRDADQAHESALKEAESDAMKRALMTFGNPFGLALYDKTQANVADAGSAAADFAIGILRTSRNLADLAEFWTKNARGLKADLSPADFRRVEKAKDEEKARLSASAPSSDTPFDEAA